MATMPRFAATCFFLAAGLCHFLQGSGWCGNAHLRCSSEVETRSESPPPYDCATLSPTMVSLVIVAHQLPVQIVTVQYYNFMYNTYTYLLSLPIPKLSSSILPFLCEGPVKVSVVVGPHTTTSVTFLFKHGLTSPGAGAGC